MSIGRKKIDPSLKRLKTGVSLSPRMMGDIDLIVSLTNSSRSAVLEASASDYLHDVAGRIRALNNRSRRNPDKPFVISDPVVLAFIRQVHLINKGTFSTPFMIFSPGGGDVDG